MASIDLAVAQGDPELMRLVRTLSTDRNELIRQGVTDERRIAAVMKHATQRLDGVKPPRRGSATGP